MTKPTKPERCPAPTDNLAHLKRAMESIENGTVDPKLLAAAQKVIHTTVAHLDQDAKKFPAAATLGLVHKKNAYTSTAEALGNAIDKGTFGDKGALLNGLKTFMTEHKTALTAPQSACYAVIAESKQR